MAKSPQLKNKQYPLIKHELKAVFHTVLCAVFGIKFKIMKTKVITLEVLEDNQNTIGYITLTNSKGDTFEILDSYRNEELIDFIKRSQLSKDCFIEKVILKDGYRACCGKEMSDNVAEKYCKDVWLKT